MATTLTLDDELAAELKRHAPELAEILELGVRELQARKDFGYNGLSSVLEKLASLPTPEEVLALRPGPML